MTAGRGVVHSEMPKGDVPAHGLQLWVNLSKENKMVEPAYQELLGKDIPKVKQNGVWVNVIAGESMGIKVGVSDLLYMFYTLRVYYLFYYLLFFKEICFHAGGIFGPNVEKGNGKVWLS